MIILDYYGDILEEEEEKDEEGVLMKPLFVYPSLGSTSTRWSDRESATELYSSGMTSSITTTTASAAISRTTDGCFLFTLLFPAV